MKLKQTLLGTAAYTFVTFPIAILWHLVLFEERNETYTPTDEQIDLLTYEQVLQAIEDLRPND